MYSPIFSHHVASWSWYFCVCVCSERFWEETTTYAAAWPLQFFMSVGMELLSLQGSWTACLGSAQWSPTFCRTFRRCPRTCSSYTPWKHPYPHELLPFLRHFLSFFYEMLSYKKTEHRAAASQKFFSHYLRGCMSPSNMDWLPKTAEAEQARDHRGQQSGKMSWLLHGC